MGAVKDVVTLGSVAAIAGLGAYWYLRSRGDGTGEGWSIFGGGYAGGTEKTGGAESGPLDKDGGDGGRGKDKTEGGTDKGGTDGKTGDGEKPSDGGPKGSDGDGGKGGKSKEGSGGDGKGGEGMGGGSGGGIGHGDGDGLGGGVDEVGGDGDTEGGGGDGQKMKPLNGWGDIMIEVDVPKPDISPNKLKAVGNTIYTLVGDTVFTTNLPGPLKEFNPELGTAIAYWADVALHTNYALPQGRLDPENKTHVPWINLWLDILQLVIRAENELNSGEEVD